FTMSIRDNKTIVHRLALGDATASSGSRIFTFRPEIDYVVNERFNINLFFERSSTTPFTSNSFKNSISYGGVKIRFTLSQ
ncbi:MAG: cell surface protein SprA, partial [Sphingobacteriales bacterium]